MAEDRKVGGIAIMAWKSAMHGGVVMKRMAESVLPAVVAMALFVLFPPPAAALHSTEPLLENKCYDCHSLKTGEAQENTSFVNTSAQTMPTIRSILGIGANDPAPEKLGCTFCHNSTITYLPDALSHFSSKASSHPVGRDFTTGAPAADNNYLSTVGTATPNQLDCVDCHDPALVSYPSHAAAPPENPSRLRHVTVAGEYDNLCRLCHGNGAVMPGKGNDVSLVAGVDHGDGSASVIEEDDGTVMRTGDSDGDGVDDGLGSQCTLCHEAHYSNLVKLFSDGHRGGTAVKGNDCTELCHYAGDHNDSYNTRGHGKASSTYMYKTGVPDGRGWNIDMGMACTSCHIAMDTTTGDPASRKAHVEYPDTGEKWEDYENRFNLNRNVQNWDAGSDFGNPEWGVCFDCHSGHKRHSGKDGEIIGCQDCHDEHAEGTGSNVFMIPEVSRPNGNYTVPPPADKAGEERVSYIRPRLDVKDASPPRQQPYGDDSHEYYRSDGDGVCDNSECHGSVTTPTTPGPLPTLMSDDNHSGGDLGAGHDCGSCHAHAGDKR